MQYEMNNVAIVMLPVNEIIPYWRNPRRNDKTVDALVESIPVHGFNVPIVVDKNNVVVKGHARLRAAKRLGMEEVPCVISDAPEDIIKADRIADNKIQELSSWDFGKLNFELEKHDTPIFDRLFKADENPVAKDGAAFEPVQYKPTGLGDYDFGGEDDATPTTTAYVETSTELNGADMAEYTPVVGGSETPQEVQAQAGGAGYEPQVQTGPRQCKTLCPYCGKMVTINV